MGVVLLINDGVWLCRIMLFGLKFVKIYEVILFKLLIVEYCVVFWDGIYFSYENIIIWFVILEIIIKYSVRFILVEGKYY